MSSIINKVEVEEETVVEFLTDFDIDFVSLVNHASMRAPFKIVRSEFGVLGGEVEGMLNVIQSVLVPSNVDLSVLRSEQPWLVNLNLEQVDDFDFYKKYNQVDVSKFKEGTLRIERLDGGALALVGELEEVVPSALVMRAPAEAIVMPASFKQQVLTEVDAMLSAVLGTLELREMAVKDKKRAVSGALDAFKNYVGVSLDHLGENVEVRFDDCIRSLSPKLEEISVMSDEVRQDATTEVNPEATPFFNSENIDTIGKVIEERVQKAFEQQGVEISNKLEQFMQALKTPKEEPKVEERVEESQTTITPDVTEELRIEIKRLEERLAKFEAEDSELSGRSSEVEDKEAITRANQPAEANIWQGLFLK